MTKELIRDALDKLRGAVMIVYPMQLPPYDPIRLEFEGKEDLSGSQVRNTDGAKCPLSNQLTRPSWTWWWNSVYWR